MFDKMIGFRFLISGNGFTVFERRQALPKAKEAKPPQRKPL